MKENKGKILYNKVGSGAAPGVETIVCSVGDSGKLTLESVTVFGFEAPEVEEDNTIGLSAADGTIIDNEGTVAMGNVTTPYNSRAWPPSPGAVPRQRQLPYIIFYNTIIILDNA